MVAVMAAVLARSFPIPFARTVDNVIAKLTVRATSVDPTVAVESAASVSAHKSSASRIRACAYPNAMAWNVATMGAREAVGNASPLSTPSARRKDYATAMLIAGAKNAEMTFVAAVAVSALSFPIPTVMKAPSAIVC